MVNVTLPKALVLSGDPTVGMLTQFTANFAPKNSLVSVAVCHVFQDATAVPTPMGLPLRGVFNDSDGAVPADVIQAWNQVQASLVALVQAMVADGMLK